MSDKSSTLDVERPKQKTDVTAISQALITKTGSSRFFVESVNLNFRQGITFDEYLAMRLWDTKFCSRSSLKQFVGIRSMNKIWRAANFIPGAQSLATNKIAASAILEAYGLSVPSISGLHASSVIPGRGRTSTPEALESFLLYELSYPAFGKPLAGLQSLGSASLESCDSSSGILTRQDGRKIEAKALAQEVHAAYARDGYIFQPRLVPHESVAAICGQRIATVRILTTLGPDGPKIIRACWKIPAGQNWADNFWRHGNLLASIDLEDGTIWRVVSGAGLTMSEIEQHPDTNANLLETKVPLWKELCAAALAGAAAMPDFGLLGWDIAATSSGPVIVEVNDTPDAILHQIADRRGIMDTSFKKFLGKRHDAKKIWTLQRMAMSKKLYTPSWRGEQSTG